MRHEHKELRPGAVPSGRAFLELPCDHRGYGREFNRDGQRVVMTCVACGNAVVPATQRSAAA